MHAYLITGKNREERLKKVEELAKSFDTAEITTLTTENKHTIENIRNLKSQLSYSARDPQKGRVVVIEEVQLFTQEAANAFLKTLEEPLGKTTFILTSPQAELTLETICSRCQLIDIGADSYDSEVVETDTLTTLVNSSASKRLEYIDSIKDREEGLAFCQSQLLAARQKMKEDPSLKLAELLERIEATRRDLEANVNVKIAIGDLLLNFPQKI